MIIMIVLTIMMKLAIQACFRIMVSQNLLSYDSKVVSSPSGLYVAIAVGWLIIL